LVPRRNTVPICLALLLLLPVIPAGSAAQTIEIDLLEMSERIEARYTLAETGALPPDYILLGDPSGALFFHRGFLETDSDTRVTYMEYDPSSGMLFTYRVPGHHRFHRREEIEDGYFRGTERTVDVSEMEIKVDSFEELSGNVWDRGFEKAWLEDVKYSLGKETDQRSSRGGLIDINIPINLPKPLEAIFGRGEETRLTVSGREKITIGGTSRWCANCPRTEGMPQQQKFPDLDMEQQLSVNLHGNIGEKIHVAIDHSSRGGGVPSTNRVSINYRGLEDEVIKLIEMGDTDLTLPGAQLVSYSGTAKGLFGVKAVAQAGPLDLTVIASKEEGETSSGTFSSSGGQSNEIEVYDYNYIKRQFYYLESPGDDFSYPLQYGFNEFYPVIGQFDSLEVFVTLRVDTEWRDNTRPKFFVKARTDPNNDGNFDDGEEFNQWFYLLYRGVDYDLIQDYGSQTTSPRYLGIKLRSPLGSEKALAIRYKADHIDSIKTIGDYGYFPETPISPPPEPDEFITAELICPPEDDFAPPSKAGAMYTSTWNMMFRNVYSLGLSGIEDATLTMRIKSIGTIIGSAEIHEKTKEQYLRIFGLDRYDGAGKWGTDGVVDVRQGLINFYEGYVMFPSPRPFDISWEELRAYFDRVGPPAYAPNDSIDTFVDTLDYHLQRNDDIYNTILDKNSPPHYYDIVIEAYSGSRVFNLSAYDILENTEVVSVDGVRLSKGTDYDIDYAGGVVTLKGEYGNLPPDATVKIDYQHKPLFGGGKSSLLGIGGNLYLSEYSRLNGSFLYNSVGSPKYTPRLGEEPSRTMAADINGSFQFSPGWMTSLINMLPRVDTDARSSLSLSGEVAMSIPNPNLKGEAYVDDMEGVEDSDQISLVRSTWYEASPPIDPDFPGSYMDAWPEDMEFYWYNPANTDHQKFLTTSRKDFNPSLDDRENSRQTSLFIKAINPGPQQWGGVMTGFPGGIDLTTAQYLEIWVNDYNLDEANRRGILHIDFGKIDEDFHQPDSNRFDVENLTTWTVADDIGFRGDDPSKEFNGDFSDEKWDEQRRIYRWINSRRGNSKPDSEDLNKNSRIDSLNEYYSLTLDLADSAIIDVQRDFSGSSSYWQDPEEGFINRQKSWRMYRLDMANAVVPGGIPPRLDKIQHVRIWVENIDELTATTETNKSSEHMLEISGIKFVGSRWEYNHIRDLADNEIPVPPPGQMKVKVGTINNKDNPSIYSPPIKVDQEEGIENREQSLLMEVDDFETGYSFRVMKRFFGQGSDFQQYKEISFFIRPDEDLVNGVADSLDFYFQVAYDSMNYYEVAVPIDESMKNKWQMVKVLLSDLTNMKLDAVPGEVFEKVIIDNADPRKKYTARLVGDPTLFRVRYLFAGVRNSTGMRIPQGQIWLNDIGLGSVRRDMDHAERIGMSANFGNIASFNAAYQRTGPEFRSLKQKSGSGVTDQNMTLAGKTELNHFVPTGGFKLPVSARYNKSESKPKYMTQSDVEILDEEVSEDLKTERNSYTVSVSMSRSGSSNFLMKNLFDNLKAGANYSKNKMHSPTRLDTSWSWSWNANYQIRFRKKREIPLFRGIALRYWLTDFSYNASGAKSVKTTYSLSEDRFVKSPTGLSHGWDNEMNASWDPFESVKLNYRRNERRNMMIYRDIFGIPVGKLLRFSESIRLHYQPMGNVPFLSQFNPRFEYNARYDEELDPSIRKDDDPEDTRNANNLRNIDIVFDVDVARYAVGFGKWVGVIGEDEVLSTKIASSAKLSMTKHTEKFKKQFEERYSKPEIERTERTKLDLDDVARAQENAKKTTPEEGDDPEEKKGAFSDLMVERSRRRGRGQRPEEKKEEEEEEAAEADTAQDGKKPDWFSVIGSALKMVARVEPVKGSIRMDSRSNYQRLYDRAGWMYRTGISDEANVLGSTCEERPCEPENQPLRSSRTFVLDLRSGMGLTSNLSADIRYTISKGKDEADNRISESTTTTWPYLSLNWMGLENWALLKRYARSSSFTVSYVKRSLESFGRSTEDVTISPVFNMVWHNSFSTNVTFSYSRNTKNEKNQETWDRAWSTSLELKYDIKGSKGFGIPLPLLSRKKISFESTLTTVLGISYSAAESHNRPTSTILAISPRMTYTFSKNVSGGITANYRRTAGGIYGYINHEVGLHATAEFQF
jgi:hypothetical protein